MAECRPALPWCQGDAHSKLCCCTVMSLYHLPWQPPLSSRSDWPLWQPSLVPPPAAAVVDAYGAAPTAA